MELIVEAQERLGGPEKEITAEIQIAEEVLDDARFRGAVEIDEYVAAENDVHAFHEQNFRVVLQIQPAERDELFHLRPYLEFFPVHGSKVFSFVVVSRVAKRV